VEAERLEAERLEAERLEAERLVAEQLEAERLEAERLEAERLEAERLEAERLEAEKIEKAKAQELEVARKTAQKMAGALAYVEAEKERTEALKAEAAKAEMEDRRRAAIMDAEKARVAALRVEAAKAEAEASQKKMTALKERNEMKKTVVRKVEMKKFALEPEQPRARALTCSQLTTLPVTQVTVKAPFKPALRYTRSHTLDENKNPQNNKKRTHRPRAFPNKYSVQNTIGRAQAYPQ